MKNSLHVLTARVISEKPIQLDFIFLSARHVFNGNGPACTEQKWNFEKLHEYFNPSRNCFLIRSWNSRNIERFVFSFLYSSLRFFQFKFLIYKIFFILQAFDFRIKKSFDVSNVSSLIFLISLLFTIFYLFVWHHFNIFFFWVTLHLFPFQDSRYSLFIRTRSIRCIVCSSRSVVEAVENPLCFGGRWPPEIRGISSIERRNLRYRWRSAYCSPGYRRILENQHYETDRFSDTFRQWKTSWHCQ